MNEKNSLFHFLFNDFVTAITSREHDTYSGELSGVSVFSSDSAGCIFLRWNLGEPKMLFLMLLSLALHNDCCCGCCWEEFVGLPGGVFIGLLVMGIMAPLEC